MIPANPVVGEPVRQRAAVIDGAGMSVRNCRELLPAAGAAGERRDCGRLLGLFSCLQNCTCSFLRFDFVSGVAG